MASAGGPVRFFKNGRGMDVFNGEFFALLIAILQSSSIVHALSDNVADLYARGPAVRVAIVTALDFVP